MLKKLFWRLFGWKYHEVHIRCGERTAVLEMWSKKDHGYALDILNSAVRAAATQGWLVELSKSQDSPHLQVRGTVGAGYPQFR